MAGYDINLEDVSLRRVEKEGFAAATFADEELGDISLVLDMELNEDLLSKGLAREITRRIQSKRKELDLDLEDTITLSVWLSDNSPKLNPKDWEYVKSETRASSADAGPATTAWRDGEDDAGDPGWQPQLVPRGDYGL